ncbi:CGNR zinc finger domain-containing protein [Kutzneria sp. CA-103260]|uniref:CGNR zinc finger domain-containing protein n=1 Tax=Kutzneria sp. CA-103260 TaxID=2802641 RepID=UPI001BAC45E8|nr:CGNR zinc finger domain-containing protein [Kutzneria sp. CA-103260]QUQ70406.1 CGNR zinc finger domain-containing protein [Kutzneria sp. CA-103260]
MAAGARAVQETGWDAERDVELLLAFLNTVNMTEATDVLDDELTWRQWAAERGLGAAGASHKARASRDALRAVALAHHGVQAATAPPDGLPHGSIRIELSAGVPVLTAGDALGAALAAAARLAVLGYWERIKICPADDCRWAFYDRSRNRSRTWCSMRVCGNREKARNWRERARSAAS